MVAFFCIAAVGLLVWLMQSWAKEAHHREERMANRIDELERFARTTLLEALRDNNKALVSPEMKAAVDKAAADIKAGTIKVHDYMSNSACPVQ